MAEADKNNDGQLDRSELQSYSAKPPKPDSLSRIKPSSHSPEAADAAVRTARF
ncbi:MAG: EF-hand domain-containing protein [Spartobacteria bacterium]